MSRKSCSNGAAGFTLIEALVALAIVATVLGSIGAVIATTVKGTRGIDQRLELSGPHRDHVIAFARRHGRDAAIVVATRWSAAFSDGGRAWPRPENYDAALNVSGYSIEGFADADASQLRLSDILRHLPVAVLKARYHGAAKRPRKRARG